MKKIFFTLAAVLVALTACNKTETPELIVYTTSGLVDAAGGVTGSFVHANNECTVTTDGQTWYTVTPTSFTNEATILVTVEPLTAVGGRSAVITISSAGLSQTFSLVQTSPVPPTDPTVESVVKNNAATEVTFTPLAGFDYVLDKSASWISVQSSTADQIVLSLAENTTGETRSAEVIQKTTDGNTLKTFVITQDWKNALPGELLIEEVFFTGHLTESGVQTSADGDQYVKITNNSDETVYADGLLFLLSETSSNTATTGAYYVYPEQPDALGINTVYYIPGSGKDVPLKAGKSLILALAAQDFTEAGGFDLSKADFEFVDEGNEYFPDTDNPDVPNLQSWFISSWSYTTLHNRGMESYAIAFAPKGMTAETFMADYAWVGKRVMDWNGYHFERDIQDAYLIPNDWVVDGVNCAVPEALGSLSWNPSVDAGWTGVGETQSDADRYGKAVNRKSENGKLVDTNNSTNDFNRNAVPTFAQ